LANHLWLDIYLHEITSIVNSNRLANHYWKDWHVSAVRLDGVTIVGFLYLGEEQLVLPW
tara:strand:+ start:1182 stop:1358 length:177 start_codon:yes stop_codon:yes gene_type:complete